MKHALGFLEVRGLVAGIECADAMLKAANVRLATQITTNPALITLIVEGDIGSCRAAIDAGRLAAERLGALVSEKVIGRPEADLALFVETRPRWQAPGGQPGGNGSRNEDGKSSVQARVAVSPEAPESLPIDVKHGVTELGSDPNSANTRQIEAQAAPELGSDPNSTGCQTTRPTASTYQLPDPYPQRQTPGPTGGKREHAGKDGSCAAQHRPQPRPPEKAWQPLHDPMRNTK
jgi:microcompartment protein CcmL/EutN